MTQLHIRIGLLALALLLMAPEWSRAIINADTADDVCAPTEDPCNITEVVKLVSSVVPPVPVTLDFGTRTVNVTGGGQLDFGSSLGRVLCGTLNVDPSAGRTGIKVRKTSGGQFVGGDAIIFARRGCTLDPTTPCFTDTNCDTLALGTCSAGPAGTIRINGKIAGNGKEQAAGVLLRAAGDLTIDKLVQASATGVFGSAGIIDLTSEQGNVTINHTIEAKGGGESTGGDVEIDAAVDIVINAVLNVSSTSGEDAEGGILFIVSGRDILINADLDADGGSCAGGEICIDAGRDIIVNGVSGNRTSLQASGQTFIDEDNDAFGGEGGEVDLLAGDSIILGQFTKIEADGAVPDGDGSSFFQLATNEGDVEIGGQLFARGGGNQGVGGSVEIDASRHLMALPTADVDVTAGDGGGGDIVFFAGEDLDVQAGSIANASAGNQGKGGSFTSSSTRTFLSGQIKTKGTPVALNNGDVDLEGCEIFIQNGGEIINDGGEGTTVLTGRDVLAATSITVANGASIDTSGVGGVNEFVHLAAGQLPVIEAGATIDPVPVFTFNDVRPKCPGCGNDQLDAGAGETCDDGNSVGGDGCSEDCQLETCIAQSLDYPAQPLCNDNNGCTEDSCNILSGNCEHMENCADGVACTIDQCIAMQCVSTASDALCDDSNVCTDEICNAITGCLYTNNVVDCDDGLFCDGPDGCSGGTCSVHNGNPCDGAPECDATMCNEGVQICQLAPAGSGCSDDGNICTDDECDGAGACGHANNSAPCDDGFACTVTDTCAGGACTAGAPNNALCDDGNPCTDDICQAGAGCTFPNNTDPCDDGQACTVNDTCAAGICVGDPQNCGGVCGDGSIDDGEECDNGLDNGLVGNACDSQCQLHQCGQPTGSQTPVATDSLFVLQAGVGIRVCDVCICDITGDGQENASDALGVLRRSVGLPIPFFCPPCA